MACLKCWKGRPRTWLLKFKCCSSLISVHLWPVNLSIFSGLCATYVAVVTNVIAAACMLTLRAWFVCVYVEPGVGCRSSAWLLQVVETPSDRRNRRRPSTSRPAGVWRNRRFHERIHLCGADAEQAHSRSRSSRCGLIWVQHGVERCCCIVCMAEMKPGQNFWHVTDPACLS